MGNLMTSLWTGVSGLTVSQAGLNATAHNLSNVNTKGYSRQQMINVDFNYNFIGYNYEGQKLNVGLGSTADVVRQLRNRFYDATYREEVGRQGYYEGQWEALSEIQELFGEMEGVAFQNSIEGIWDAIQELAKEPESIVCRSTLVNKAAAFIDRAQDIYTQVSKFQTDLNKQVNTAVEKINELGQQIYEMNKKISAAEASGVENANDYRDIRNLALDELSKYIKIEYSEAPNGVVQVVAEGVQFVSELSVNKIITKEISDETIMIKPVWSQTGDDVVSRNKTVDLESDSDIGYLKGLLIARGDDTAQYTDIPVKPVEPKYPARTDYMVSDGAGGTVFDSVAYNAAVDKYNIDNEEYKLELNRFNTSLVEYNNSIDSSVIRTIMATFDQLVHGVVTGINDILAPNKEVVTFDSGGTPIKITVLDEDKAPIGMDVNATMGEGLFNRKSMDRYTTQTLQIAKTDEKGNILTDADGNWIMEEKTVRVYNGENPDDNYSLYTITEIEINPKILENYSILPLSNNGNGGDFAYTGVMHQLSDIWNKSFTTLSPNTLTPYTYKEYYTAFVGDIGTRGQLLENMTQSQSQMALEVDNTRQNYMGVSSDEELSNLMKYQHSYNAAARYFNVVDSMLERILTMF
ncbi:MAG: flagellar hook-associated protein FlgK [Lachnospiraceae bacterium]|nr:flagellar hook-associated protein FlgK [Lachnospiraceae bacterium]